LSVESVNHDSTYGTSYVYNVLYLTNMLWLFNNMVIIIIFYIRAGIMKGWGMILTLLSLLLSLSGHWQKKVVTGNVLATFAFVQVLDFLLCYV